MDADGGGAECAHELGGQRGRLLHRVLSGRAVQGAPSAPVPERCGRARRPVSGLTPRARTSMSRDGRIAHGRRGGGAWGRRELWRNPPDRSRAARGPAARAASWSMRRKSRRRLRSASCSTRGCGGGRSQSGSCAACGAPASVRPAAALPAPHSARRPFQDKRGNPGPGSTDEVTLFVGNVRAAAAWPGPAVCRARVRAHVTPRPGGTPLCASFLGRCRGST